MTGPVEPTALQNDALVAQTALAQTAGDAAVMRVGVITQYNFTTVTVAISGSDVLVDAAYLHHQYQPDLGDIVAVIKAGAAWLVLGTFSGMPANNQVANPSFELDLNGATTITDWGIYHNPAGPATAAVSVHETFRSQVIDGSKRVAVENMASASVALPQLYSSAIIVTPGEMWSASAYFTSYVDPNGTASVATVEILLTWYAGGADVYPNTVAADSSVGSLSTLFGDMPFWVLLRAPVGDGVVVPAGANYMRVLLSATLRGSESQVWWDRVTARKIRNADGSLA